MRRLAALVSLLVAIAAVACGEEPTRPVPDATAKATATPDATAAAAPDLVVSVERSRAAAGRGVLEVRLRTGAAEPFEVTRLQLLDDRFASVPPEPKSTPVRAGGVGIITPIPAGEVVCDAGRGEGPRMAVSLDTGDGAFDLVVPVAPEGDGLLTSLHADECRRLGLIEAVDVVFGEDWETVSPATAHGTIRLDRRTAVEEVVLEGVQGTVIFTLRLLDRHEGDVLVLPVDRDVATVAVEVSAARCDPHALIESKKTYLFPMWVRRGEEPTVFLTVQPTGPARTAFEGLLREGCGLE